MTFIILSFIFFSFVLGPFLYTTPPRFSAGAGSSGQQCEGEKVNVTRIQTMEDDMKSLYKELNNAIEANIMEKKRALDLSLTLSLALCFSLSLTLSLSLCLAVSLSLCLSISLSLGLVV